MVLFPKQVHLQKEVGEAAEAVDMRVRRTRSSRTLFTHGIQRTNNNRSEKSDPQRTAYIRPQN